MRFTLRQEASNKKTFFNIDASDSIGKSYEIEIKVYFYSRNSLTSLFYSPKPEYGLLQLFWK